MAVKLRLQRHGRKKKPIYHIVAADSRAPRDSNAIQKIGFYNPHTNPATIELDLNDAVNWLEKGAQPTDTVRAILSYKGAIYKAHLNKGVKKGAMTQEQADAKFNAWIQEKIAKIESKKDTLGKAKSDLMSARLEHERRVKADIAAKIAAKNAPVAEEGASEVEATEEVATEENNEATESTEETPAE